jgi:hypothetical protein
MGESSYSKTQVPFHVESKVDIKPYTKKVDAISLNQWLQQMEVYFIMHEEIGKKKIVFSCLKLEGHALKWWESDAVRKELGNEPLVTDWQVLKDMIKSQFYLIGYEETQQIIWNYFRQRLGQSMQEFTKELRKREICIQLVLFIPKKIDEAIIQAQYLEGDNKKKQTSTHKQVEPQER